MARRLSSACCWYLWGCAAVIIALSLALNVLGTLLIMYIWDRTTTDLPRALIIALSMLVDNAIVIVEECSSPVSKALRCWARLTV